MSTKSNPPSADGLRILVIHAPGHRPAEAPLRKLLRDARCKVADLVFAIPAQITVGEVDPSEFDKIITILDAELAEDEELEGAMIAVAQGGHGATGIWPAGAQSEGMHPAVARYGKCQIPWDPIAASKALNTNAPESFQSAAGGVAASHDIKPNKC
jgi:hypothetical protein